MCDGLGQNKIVRAGKNSSPKCMKDWDNVGDSIYFPMLLLNCLCHISFRRYSSLSLKVVEKPKNVKFFGPQFFSKTTPTVLWQIVKAIYCPSFGTVWFNYVCWSPSAKPGNEMQTLCRVGKHAGPIWSRLFTKVHVVLRRCRRPLGVFNALHRLSLSCFIPKI